jgi:hypothetical protein
VALAAIAAAAVALSGFVIWDRRPGSPAGPPAFAGCDSSLRVVTASSFAPVLDNLTPRLERGNDCVEVDVRIADGRSAASQVAELDADVWIPDDTSWAATAADDLLLEPGKAGSGTVIATSPIYMVTGPATARRLQAGGSWKALAELLTDARSGVRLVVSDPGASGDGLVAAGDVGEAVWIDEGMDASSLALATALRVTRTVPGREPAMPSKAGEVGLVPEHVLLAMPEQKSDLAVLTGSDYTGMLRFSWLPTAAALADRDRAAALRKLLRLLSGPGAVESLAAAGLRGPDVNSPPGPLSDRTLRLTAKPFEVLGPHHMDHVFATWYPADRRTNVLVVVDVSGSMAERAPDSKHSIIALVRQGCLRLSGLLPDDSQLGLWKFGSRLDRSRDYRLVLPPALLDDRHRQRLSEAVGNLTASPTGTGLYDTILAAYQAAQRAYRPGVLNQVLLFTDGRNEDDPGSISAKKLTTQLSRVADPRRPVQMVIAAFGPEAQAEELDKILAPVGGYVDSVYDAAGVEAAFVHVAAGGLSGH